MTEEEKLVEEYIKENGIYTGDDIVKQAFLAGYHQAQNTITQCNRMALQGERWHYVKDELPEKKYDKVEVTVVYLNAYKNPCKKDCFYDGTNFVYWDSGKNVGWKKVDIFGLIYAWKYSNDFLPEPPKIDEVEE